MSYRFEEPDAGNEEPICECRNCPKCDGEGEVPYYVPLRYHPRTQEVLEFEAAGMIPCPDCFNGKRTPTDCRIRAHWSPAQIEMEATLDAEEEAFQAAQTGNPELAKVRALSWALHKMMTGRTA